MFRNKLNYFKYQVLGLKTSDISHYTKIIEKVDIVGEFVGNYSSGGVRYIEKDITHLKNNQPTDNKLSLQQSILKDPLYNTDNIRLIHNANILNLQ